MVAILDKELTEGSGNDQWGEVPFIEYVNAADNYSLDTYGIDAAHYIDMDMIASGQEQGDSPYDLVDFYASKYGMQPII